MNIHPSAIVSAKAKLAADVEVGPYAVIEDDVQIGQRTKIYSHAHILKHTSLGADCQVHMGAVLGHRPQLRQRQNSNGRLTIACRNIFREYCTVHRASRSGASTHIGADNYFMAFAHIAHDCQIGNQNTICNGALLAGHVTVEDFVFISGNVTVHQFCRIGKFSMIAGLARVNKDVPPFMLVKGDSLVRAINSIGLRRGNFSPQSRRRIKQAFKLLYRSNLNVQQATAQLKEKFVAPEISDLVNFIQQTRRGICGHKNLKLYERIRLGRALTVRGQIPAYHLFQAARKQRIT